MKKLLLLSILALFASVAFAGGGCGPCEGGKTLSKAQAEQYENYWKSLSPEERKALKQARMETLKSLSPEERKALRQARMEAINSLKSDKS